MLAGFKSVIRIALALSLALPYITPPTIEHRHVHGDQSHSHELAEPDHDEVAEHQHYHDADEDDHGMYLSAASDLHRHWFFLGWELSWPVPQHDDDDQPRPQTTIVSIIGDETLSFSPSDSWSALILAAPDTPGCRKVPVVRPSPQRFRAELNLLCDTARHERSGVQLA
jgi:hypothetical protein